MCIKYSTEPLFDTTWGFHVLLGELGGSRLVFHHSSAEFSSTEFKLNVMYGKSNQCVDILFQQELRDTHASILGYLAQGHDADRLQIRSSGPLKLQSASDYLKLCVTSWEQTDRRCIPPQGLVTAGWPCLKIEVHFILCFFSSTVVPVLFLSS